MIKVGEEIIVTEHGRSVARLVPVKGEQIGRVANHL
jgi:antitoxin (DNA-binding transcriptional repressor) of toxin-antitoxin stability system